MTSFDASSAVVAVSSVDGDDGLGARAFTLAMVGVSHKSAPVELRERLAIGPSELKGALAALRAMPGVEEAVLLSTCNRVEAYLAGSSEALESGRRFFSARARGMALGDRLVCASNADAVEHLFRVAASLDSMVVGEPQILGQLKEAFGEARDVEAAGGSLTRLFQAAISAAKRVRTETAIGAAPVSMASAAAELAQRCFDTSEGRTLLLIGAGEMSVLAARHLTTKGTRIVVLNRTFERARALASEIGAEAAAFDTLPEWLTRADIVITSTAAPQPILGLELVRTAMRARQSRPLFFIDLAVPRDVEETVGALPHVQVFNVDDLGRRAEAGRQARVAESRRAEEIVHDEVARYLRAVHERGSVPVLSLLRERGETVALGELERTLATLGDGLTDKQRKSIEAMGRAIVNKLLHAPTVWLRSAGGKTPEEAAAIARLATSIFDLRPRLEPVPRLEALSSSAPSPTGSR